MTKASVFQLLERLNQLLIVLGSPDIGNLRDFIHKSYITNDPLLERVPYCHMADQESQSRLETQRIIHKERLEVKKPEAAPQI